MMRRKMFWPGAQHWVKMFAVWSRAFDLPLKRQKSTESWTILPCGEPTQPTINKSAQRIWQHRHWPPVFSVGRSFLQPHEGKACCTERDASYSIAPLLFSAVTREVRCDAVTIMIVLLLMCLAVPTVTGIKIKPDRLSPKSSDYYWGFTEKELAAPYPQNSMYL